MAPDPKKHSVKKGKARMYMCSACNTRHASPTRAKCEVARKRKVSEDDSTQSSGREKRRHTTGLPRHSSPRVAPQMDSLEEESMKELLARLDGPPFPTKDETFISDAPLLPRGSPLVKPGPLGTSQGLPHEGQVTSDMFNILCEQMALLADAQTRDRQRIDRESKANMDLIAQSMAQFSRQLAVKQAETIQQLPSQSVQGTVGSTRQTFPVDGESLDAPIGAAQTCEEAPQPAPGMTECYVLPSGVAWSERIGPGTLAATADQVRTLRRHRPSANNATAIWRWTEKEKRWGS